MRRCIAVVAASVCAAVSAQVVLPESAYRPGMPLVAVPVEVAPQGDFDAAGFARAYSRAGRPTIALLWNRELSDTLEQPSLQVRRDERDLRSRSASLQEAGPSRDYFAQREVNTSVQGELKLRQARRASPGENADLQMRSAFVNSMASLGVVLVDRNLVMRKTSLDKVAPDSQRVEIEALSKHAKLLLEVLNTPDTASPAGWATQFTIKRFSDGAVLATGYFDGRPTAPMPKRFEPDPNGGGFREVPAAALVPSELGRLAAEQALGQLAVALAR